MPSGEPRVGYVLKVYPRFSETFIVTELLAHQAAGLDVEVFSLRPPTEGRFHASVSAVRAPVTYLQPPPSKAAAVWDLLLEARRAFPSADVLGLLAAADLRDAVAAVELATCVRERGITHLHAHFGSVATTVARLAAALAGVPYTFTAHAKDIFHVDVRDDDLAVKLRDAAAVVTVSDFNAAHLRQRFGTAARGVERIYNGLDLDAFGYGEPRRRPPLVAGVGRLVEKKGFDVLIRACALLRDSGRELRCVIAGAGEREALLAAEVQRLGLSGVVHLAGPLPQEQVRELVSGAAVLAAPCVVAADGNRDGLPTVVLEGMALGTPVVATDVTGMREAVHHDVTGLMVAQHDTEGLAAAIARLLDDADLRVRLAGAARRLVEERFDATTQAARLRALFAAPTRLEAAS